MILNAGPVIGIGDLPDFLTASQVAKEEDLKSARQAFERAHIRRVLERCDGDKRRAADLLGIDLSSLYRKLEEPDRSLSG